MTFTMFELALYTSVVAITSGALGIFALALVQANGFLDEEDEITDLPDWPKLEK